MPQSNELVAIARESTGARGHGSMIGLFLLKRGAFLKPMGRAARAQVEVKEM